MNTAIRGGSGQDALHVGAESVREPAEPIYTAHDGKVFHRGCYVPPFSYAAQRAAFDAAEAAGDWWAPFAADLRDQLQSAIREAHGELQ